MIPRVPLEQLLEWTKKGSLRTPLEITLITLPFFLMYAPNPCLNIIQQIGYLVQLGEFCGKMGVWLILGNLRRLRGVARLVKQAQGVIDADKGKPMQNRGHFCANKSAPSEEGAV